MIRSWPVIRRWFWQPEEIAEAERRAHELAVRLGWRDDEPTGMDTKADE